MGVPLRAILILCFCAFARDRKKAQLCPKFLKTSPYQGYFRYPVKLRGLTLISLKIGNCQTCSQSSSQIPAVGKSLLFTEQMQIKLPVTPTVKMEKSSVIISPNGARYAAARIGAIDPAFEELQMP